MTEKKDRFITIKEMFEDVLDEPTVQIFRFIYDGDLCAANNKRTARVSISIPRTIVNQNLKDIDNFVFFGVAIPREVIKNLPNKDEVKE